MSAPDAARTDWRYVSDGNDIKPSNIMVVSGPSGALSPVIMDFGLARQAEDARGLTQTGAVMGTPAYMSPEQARGEVRNLDRRSDVYSLGATLYELLCGQAPFDGSTAVDILLQVLGAEPHPLRARMPHISPDLETITMKCLQKEPGLRYESARLLRDDLQRFTDGEPILGRRVSLSYRAQRWARRQKALVGLSLISLIVILSIVGYGVRLKIQADREKKLAAATADLARQLGQEVKDIEWTMRTAYVLPVHDVRPERKMVQQQLSTLERQLGQHRDVAEGLALYALGRGYLALHEYERAHPHLLGALRYAQQIPEVYYALGRTLVERYNQALRSARRQGDSTWLAARRRQLEQELLRPALEYLHRSREVGVKIESPTYVDGLLAFYNEQYEQALAHAQAAVLELPWLYEAHKLQGDVFLEKAIKSRDVGDIAEAERSFARAISSYERAADVGRSDADIYEGIAEVWVRRIEMAKNQGKDPTAMLTAALAACDRAIAAAPWRSTGYTKKSFVYLFMISYLMVHKEHDKVRENIGLMLAAAETAIQKNPDDYYAYEVFGDAYKSLAYFEQSQGRDPTDPLNRAIAALQKSLSIQESFPWGLNDLGRSYVALGSFRSSRGQDPAAEFSRAIELYKRALQLDPQYTMALVNVADAYGNWAEHMARVARDPSEMIVQCVKYSRIAITLNKMNRFSYTNIIWVNLRGVQYSALARRDPSRYIQEIEEVAAESTRLFGSLWLPDYENMGGAYTWNAQYLLTQGRDPMASVEKAEALLAECLKQGPRDSVCWIYRAHLELARSGWQRLSGQARAALQSLLRAEAAADQAVSIDAHGSGAQLARALVELRLIEAQQPGTPALLHAEKGLLATEKVLTTAPNQPLGTALRGALLSQQAQKQSSPALRQELASQARTLLDRALQQTPILRTEFGAYVSR